MTALAQLTALAWVSLSAAPAPAATPAPSASDMARCAAVAAPDARLACYDALAGRPADGPHAIRAEPPAAAVAAAPPVVAVPPVAAAPATAVAPAARSTAVAGPVAAAAPVPAPASSEDAEQNFGLSQSQPRSAPKGPQAIQAHIASIGEDQLRRPIAVLDNGQTWVFIDQDRWPRAGDAITIRRATLGSFIMIAPSNHTYHVHRTQ